MSGIIIDYTPNFYTVGAFFAPGATYDQSMWLKDNGGFGWFGRNTPDDLAAKLRAAGVPFNCRWISGSKAEMVAARLNGAANVEFTAAAKAKLGNAAENIVASRTVDADIDIPVPAGLEFFPFQRGGISFALNALESQNGVLIADEMGLGKTMQAIGVMIARRPARTLIVCPATLRNNWRNELRKWFPSCGDIQVPATDEQISGGASVVIINYDRVTGSNANAKRLRSYLKTANWDMLILDEGHVLKNEKAQRTEAFFGKFKYDRSRRITVQTADGVVHRSAKTLVLTGTPIQNKVRESLSLLRAIGAVGDHPNAIGNEGRFLSRYCGMVRGAYGTTFDGAGNLDELQSKLRNGWMIRRLKSQVLAELPPKLRAVVPVNGDVAEQARAIEREVFGPTADTLYTATDNARSFEAVKSLMGQTVAFERIAAMRAKLAVLKADAAIAHVQDIVDSGEKVIVFAHHHSLLDAIENAFDRDSIRIDGTTSPDRRQMIVDRFQTDARVKVAILGTHAAGVGITLTAASKVVFAEADYNPSWAQQAEDRAHRIGQTDTVNVDYLVFDGTLDARVLQIMVNKMDIADRALDRSEVQATTAAPVAEPARQAQHDVPMPLDDVPLPF